MAENPNFMTLLNKMAKIHASKVEDYSSVGHYDNFTRQAEVMSWFKADIDKAFAGLITVKLARLAALLSSNKPPNHESIEDSFLDLATYATLWGSYYASLKNEVKPGEIIYGKRDCNHIWNWETNDPFCVKCGLTRKHYDYDIIMTTNQSAKK